MPTLDVDTQRRLQQVVRKVQENVDGLAENEDRRSLATLLAMAGSKAARKACYCGHPNHVNTRGWCGQWRLCHHCAARKKAAALRSYIPAIPRGKWYFLTIAFEECLPLEMASPHGRNTVRQAVLARSMACTDSVAAMVKEQEVLGSYSVEETAVISLVPPTVQVHLHAVLHAEADLPEGFVERLTGRVVEELRGHGVDAPPPVSVRTTAILDKAHLGSAIGYITKPVNLVAAYRQTLWRAGTEPQEVLRLANEQVTLFLPFLASLLDGRRQPRRKGSLHGRSRTYAGVRKRTWRPYAETLAEIQDAFASRPPEPLDD